MKRLVILTFAAFAFGGSHSFSAPEGMIEERLQQLLKRVPAADLNHDGKLTVDEFRQFKAAKLPDAVPPKAPDTPPVAPPAAAGKLTFHITSRNAVSVNPKIYGINCAEMFIFDLVQKPEYLSALGELQFNTFLFPGGSSYHHPVGTGGFNIKEEEIAQSKHGTDHRINKVGSPDFFEQYLGFIKPMGGHAVFIPNIPNGTVAELDWYLQKMMAAQVPVETVVLGMEVQLGAFRFESSTAYIEKIKPFIELLKSKYPKVRIGAWSTPVGRRANTPESFRQWNQTVAKVPGIDGFAQYGWTEFGGAALRKRGSAEATTPEQRLASYDAFVRDFPDKEIKAYADDWGPDKKMFMLQWGTHQDRNTALEGLHSVNFLFFMTQYNAAHDNYFEVASWSVPLMSDLTSGKRRGAGTGVTYQKDIALWSACLYAKPLRPFFSGDKSLLTASVEGAPKQGEMDVVKVLASTGSDGRKYLCILNRGPATTLGALTVDDQPVSLDVSVQVESVSADSLTTSGAGLKIFAGHKSLASLPVESFSVTTVTLP